MRSVAIMFAAAVLVCGLHAAWAAPIVIDLEASPGPDGVIGTADDIPTPLPCDVCSPLGDLGFGAIGVHFTSGTLFAGNFFPDHGSSNHYSSSTVPDATLSVPIYGIRLRSYSVWTLTLYAFGASGEILATSTFTNPSANFVLTELRVSSSNPIARFTVRPEGCLPSAPSCDHILNIDDMVFDTAPEPPGPTQSLAAIPSLNGWMLGLLAGLIVCLARRRGAS